MTRCRWLVSALGGVTALLVILFWFSTSNVNQDYQNENRYVPPQILTKCAEKRILLRNVISQHDCKAIIRLAQDYHTDAKVGYHLRGSSIDDIVDGDNYNITQLEIMLSARRLIHRVVTTHFQLIDLCWDFSHITSREAGPEEYSHFTHVDNCRWNKDTGECIPMDESCCEWRSYSALLYLNSPPEFEGGDFFFEDWDDECVPKKPPKNLYATKLGKKTRIHFVPECGTLVGFSSGPENVHGVRGVKSGVRWAFAVWFTFNCTHHAEIVRFNDGRYSLDRSIHPPGEYY